MIRLDLAALEHEVNSLFELHPELREDEEFRLNVLEGETLIVDVIRRIVRDKIAADAHADGIDDTVKMLRDRKARLQRRAEADRQLVEKLMRMADLRKLPLPECTVSFRSIAAGVEIIDESKLPDRFMRVKREPDKTAIKEALKDGLEVPGATLSNGGESISFRIL